MTSHIDPELTPEETFDGMEDYDQTCPYSQYIEDDDEQDDDWFDSSDDED